ncbi:MAG: methyltransferase domain-containing protein [Myxococcota bacterium]
MMPLQNTAQTCLSHETQPRSLQQAMQTIQARICAQGDLPNAHVQQQLKIVDALAAFGLGRFLITHRGLNGYWTRYMAGLDPHFGLSTGVNPEGKPLSELEQWMLSRSRPAYVLPTRMREVQNILQNMLQDDMVLASVPCGAMDDLLRLDFSTYHNVHLVGIDVDPHSLQLAERNAKERGLSSKVELIERDAWSLEAHERFDALVCHGLTAYEPNLKRVQVLYEGFYRALKPGGIFLTHLSTLPPKEDPQSSWNIDAINMKDIAHDEIIFRYVLNLKPWHNRRTQQQIKELLHNAGFANIRIKLDKRGICPAVIAKKSDPL